ncbi:MAG: hypothetical protein HN348_23600 [Proteobacteria bacterium]|jgi:hypothetical protein|nr:hypothetical protein [Pseudomonadota bacterium]
MDEQLQSVFEVIEPPCGGVNTLRGRLEEHRSYRGWGLGFGLVSVAFAATIALVVLSVQTPTDDSLDLGDNIVAIALGLVEPPVEPVVSTQPDRFAVMRVSVTDDVIFYRTAGLGEPEQP